MKKLDNDELLEKTRRFIDKANVNKAKFARSAGISDYTLYEWLNGKRAVSPATLEKINDYLSQFNSILR